MEESNHDDSVYHIELYPAVRAKLDRIRKDNEPYHIAVARLADDRLAVLDTDLHNEDAKLRIGFSATLQENLNRIREPGESFLSVIDRLLVVYASVEAEKVKSRLALYPVLFERLDGIREPDEPYHAVIDRLIDEHKIALNQQSETPLGTTEALRVQLNTRDRIAEAAFDNETFDDAILRILTERDMCLSRDDGTFNDVVRRLLVERDAYRMVALDMAEDGRRLLLNQDSIVANFKLIIRELVTVDTIRDHESTSILSHDVDELVERITQASLEGDDL